MKNNFNSKHNHKNANPNNSKMKGYDFMKKTNKFAAFALAACMMAPMAMATTASFTASATDVTISSSSDKATHTYTAYKIFDGSYSTNGLTVTGWTTGFDSAGLLADADFKSIEIVTDSTTDPVTTSTIGAVIGSNTDAAAVAQAIEKIASNSSTADKLASVLAKYVGTSGTELSGTAVDLPAGYYIVKDVMGTDNTHDAVSKFILEVSGGTTPIDIVTKKSYPTVEKKVKENVKAITGTPNYDRDTTEKWNDVADYNIGDAVPFKLYGTMPDTLDDYEHYYYQFSDSLGKQFEKPENIKVYIDGKEIAPASGVCEVSTAVALEDGSRGPELMVKFNDIKSIDIDKDTAGIQSIKKDSIVTIEYTAVLNSKAEIGLPGQENKVKLVYSNNPNATGNGTTNPGDTGETPEDKVIVFTYELDTTKVDKATSAKLADAKFRLYRENGSTKEYVKVDTNSKVTGWTTNDAEASTLISDTNGLFKVIGLDDGTYFLEETEAPGSYNKLTAPVTVVIKAETANNQSWNSSPADALTKLDVTADGKAGTGDAATGIASINIANSKGSTLPSTGGIGTTIFYVLGGTLVVGSGIALVTKKRLGKNED